MPISRISPLRPSDPLKMSQKSHTSGGSSFGIHLRSSPIEIDHSRAKIAHFDINFEGFLAYRPKMAILGSKWSTLVVLDEIQGISKSGWCLRVKCPPGPPETEKIDIRMIWKGF